MTHEEQVAIFAKLEREALEKTIAQPAVAHALHAISIYPDLMKALQTIADLEILNPTSAERAMLQTARAAIAKATGE